MKTTTTATKLAPLLRLSQKVYERDFYGHVFANLVRYIYTRCLENQPNEICRESKGS